MARLLFAGGATVPQPALCHKLSHSPLISHPACRNPARLQEFSSVGRASVSKTEGRGFESPNSCQANRFAIPHSGTQTMATTNPVQFLQQVRAEVAKVVWPTRREVVLTTIMVFIMAALTATFFSLVDLAIRFGLTAIVTGV